MGKQVNFNGEQSWRNSSVPDPVRRGPVAVGPGRSAGSGSGVTRDRGRRASRRPRNHCWNWRTSWRSRAGRCSPTPGNCGAWRDKPAIPARRAKPVRRAQRRGASAGMYPRVAAVTTSASPRRGSAAGPLRAMAAAKTGHAGAARPARRSGPKSRAAASDRVRPRQGNLFNPAHTRCFGGYGQGSVVLGAARTRYTRPSRTTITCSPRAMNFARSGCCSSRSK